jgi:hypothetical protein
VPLIALEGLDASNARRRSVEIARADWQEEAGGLGALRAATLVPVAFFVLDAKLLFSGHVHSAPGRALLAIGVLCGFAFGTVVGVVRQVFAVSLDRRTESDSVLAA